ncbi:ABC transporter permease [Xanthocytophaga agilis]|uniref:ABC transporter permease n=1 Tax=Xanthocytophaga agilis TaxID=3048010 RepID=A0AAE3R276_9BACT|nr:ABC transporter permease [Xanthocytophaga agilis]MDJ1499974.1 ABC transporter permease [Xanthocytophaga agilis]
MNIQLIKAVRDLTYSPKRSLTVVFALLLGIWGVGTVGIAYVILTHDLQENYLRTLPAHAVFTSSDFDKQDTRRLLSLPEIESAEFRDFSLHRIEVRSNVWIPLWLYSVDDFSDIKLARIFHQEGAATPEKGSVLIERDGKNVSVIRNGSIVNVRIGSSVKTVKVSGICFDPGQAPATQDAFIYAYTDPQTYQQITGLLTHRRIIVRFRNVHSAEEVEQKVHLLTDVLQRSGVTVQSIDIPRFNEHPHQWQLNTLLFLIGAIGLLAFLMGAVLVSQLVRSMLVSHVRQIGILKAIGASRFHIFRMYIFVLLVIGAMAGGIAIPLASVSSQAFAGFVAGKLNFDILTKTVPIQVYLYLLLLSLSLPVLLSLGVIVRGTKIAIRIALSDYGIVQQSKWNSYAIVRRLKLSEAWIMAIRNAQRSKRRLVVTVLTMALGVAIFCTGFNVRQSLWNLLEGQKDELRYDVQVVLDKPVSRQKALQPFQKLTNVKTIEMWVGGRGEIQSKVIATTKGIGIVALPAKTQRLHMKILQGRWLQVSKKVEVVINQQAWALYNHPEIGSSFDVTIGNKICHVTLVGIAEQFEKPKIYLDIAHYDNLVNPSHLINTLVFVAKENRYDQVMALKREIESAISSSDLNVVYVMSQAERVRIIYAHLNIILTNILILSFLVLVVSAVGMASATGINIWERTREIGVMRAIGATSAQIYSLFVREGFLISIMSVLLGLIIAYPLSQLAALFFGNLMLGQNSILAYAFSIPGFLITLVVTLLFGWLASRIPARSAIAISTRQALVYE